LRDWLSSLANGLDQDALQRKLHGFVFALLTVTQRYLENLETKPHRAELEADELRKRTEGLASTFRQHMTTGQSFNSTNDYRQRFFDEVIDTAKQVSFLSPSPFERMTCLSVHEAMQTDASDTSTPCCISVGKIWSQGSRKCSITCS
jgi:hypothetical protein